MNANRKTKVPPKVSEMSKEELRAFVKKKRECDAKANTVVMKLLDDTVTCESLLELLPFISQTHYEDVTVERALVKICGYPVCDMALDHTNKLPKQTYKICTATNRVYDVTSRRNFCSDRCYKSSEFLKQQILTTPLWFREPQDVPRFRLPPPDIKGVPGERVDLSLTEKITVDDKENFTSCLQFTQDSLRQMSLDEHTTDFDVEAQSECPEKSDAEKEHCTKKNNDDTPNTVDKPSENADIKPPKSPSVSKKKKDTVTSKKSQSALLGDVVEKKSENKIDPMIAAGQQLLSQKRSSLPETTSNADNFPSLKRFETSLAEWFTFDSLIFVFGESRIKEMIADKSDALKQYLDNLSHNSGSSATYLQYQKLCRKLNFLELEDRKYDSEVLGDHELKPLPDYTMLKEESEKLTLKVHSYYRGEMVTPERKRSDTAEPKDSNEEDDFNAIPLVDKYAQNALRRKIVLNALDKALPDLLRALDVAPREISGDVRQLMVTFDLRPHNITFKTQQWNLIAIVVIKLLSIRGPKLENRLSMPTAVKHLELILLSYGLDSGYLDRFVWWLTDIDRLLSVDPVGLLK